ncbi:MAG: hypothetical protein IT380_19935 [Myxococcales bacterium]|nr:hypothetical protein [Myxococcales bacterium]
MASRQAARAEARFLRGETGVDGASGKEELDPSEVEQAKAREALLRGRTWLGRECLTWLLWKSESTEPITSVDEQPLSVVFHGRLVLRAGAGDVTELSVKGVTSPYSPLVRAALAKGLLVHGARLQLTHGEQQYDVGVDAETFDVKGAKLPALIQEEEGERITERLELAGRLSHLLDALVQAFVTERMSRGWASKTVPALQEWMAGR